jgi:pyruvate formate lyase activating enzyme
MRCKYCHNCEFLEQDDGFLSDEYVINFLKKRIGLFDGVVLSGGECTISDELVDFVEKIKKLGFKIKIDTNGLNCTMLENLIASRLVDFVALDFKSPKNKFKFITQIDNSFYDKFEKTLIFLVEKVLNKIIDLEVRTTVHTALLQENDINMMIDILDNLKYNKIYYIQNFKNENKDTLVDLGQQQFLLDKNKIKNPNNFVIDYRNFF